jgi:poly(A) polymerase
MKARKLATEIVKTLGEAGFIAYFAGGWVRDYLLGHPSADIDIATSASTADIARLFPRTIPVGESFGVMIVLIDNLPFEVATFRKDIEYVDGRKPSKIELTSAPLEDAQRRDFTINGMFYDPIKGEVIDFVNGKTDLTNGLVRAIGNPNERFVEDRLRMIRAVRIASKFGFKIHPDTEAAIQKNAHTLFPAVAMERIWNELKKMGDGNHFDKAILDLHKFGLLQIIFPLLKAIKSKEIQSYVSVFHKFPDHCPTIFYLMELFPQETPESRQAICLFLKTSAKEMQLVEFLDHTKKMVESTHDIVEWAYFYADPRSETVLKVIAARKGDEFLQHHHHQQAKLKKHIERIITKKPLVSAKHLQNEGIAPGRQMGSLLKESERIAITQDLHHAAEVLSQLKKSPAWTERTHS